MSNFKNELKAWQQIPLDLINDDDLSIQARFIYVKMASKPEGWNFYQEPLASELRLSVSTLQKYLGELLMSGWLIRGYQQHSEDGKFQAVEYTLKSALSEADRDLKNTVRQNLPYRKIYRTEKFGVHKHKYKKVDNKNPAETITHTHTAGASEIEKAINEWMAALPNLACLRKPTEVEWKSMIQHCNGDRTKLSCILRQMNNKPQLMKQYTEVYMTFLTFLEKDKIKLINQNK